VNLQLRRKLILAVLLLILSAAAYVAHWALFHNAHDIFYYLLLDVAFLFVQAVLAMLILDGLLNAHERQAIAKKVNVVIGIFFSQVGTPLLRLLSGFDSRADHLRQHLKVDGAWSAGHFAKMQMVLRSHEASIDARRDDLATLKVFLRQERDFLVQLLENPNLLEHETLTESLWAVFHLADELDHRESLTTVSEADGQHLSQDIRRAYDLLIRGWLLYIQHLKSDYPFLFSLAVRTNPFDPEARVEIS
jgi:hypothetical protein